MQVTVEKTANLERQVKVVVPEGQLKELVSSKFSEVRKQARIPGFRPGKIPDSVLQQRFGESIRAEAIDELISKTLPEAIDQEKLKVASVNKLEPTQTELDKPLEYTATVEVYPDFELNDLSGQKIETIKAEVADEDVDKALDKIRKDKAEWHKVERPAQHDDRLNLNFVGTRNGEPFENGSAENVNLVIGSNRFIPGFEEGLLGTEPGADITLKLTFPEEYFEKSLAGQPVEFAVKINSIHEPRLPELNEEFLKAFQIEDGDVDTLRDHLRKSLARECHNAVSHENKKRVFDKLVEVNDIEVPKSLVQNEVHEYQQQMLKNANEQMRQHSFSKENVESLETDMTRRVKLSLLLNKLIEDSKLEVDSQQVKAYIDEMAQSYQDPEAAISMYYRDKKLLSEVESTVLEEQVMAKLLENAKVNEKTFSMSDALDLGRGQQ